MKKNLFEPKVVQFFHSGSEFPQKKIDETHKHKPWSVNSHTRNFIKCKGEYVDKSGRKKQGTLVFWGEWEAEADVVEFYELAGLLPKRLISPTHKQKYPSGYSSCVNKTGCRKKEIPLNTDPFVFGECFRYSNCQQLSRKNVLQKISPNSIILFGSHKGNVFLLDTVFVADDNSIRFSKKETLKSIRDFNAYKKIVLDYTLPLDNPGASLVYYEGKTYQKKGMFSFSPAKIYGPGCRFERIALDEKMMKMIVGKAVNMKKTQGIRTIDADVEKTWKLIRDFVLEKGCVLGVRFDLP